MKVLRQECDWKELGPARTESKKSAEERLEEDKEVRAKVLAASAGPGTLAFTGPILHSRILSGGCCDLSSLLNLLPPTDV